MKRAEAAGVGSAARRGTDQGGRGGGTAGN